MHSRSRMTIDPRIPVLPGRRERGTYTADLGALVETSQPAGQGDGGVRGAPMGLQWALMGLPWVPVAIHTLQACSVRDILRIEFWHEREFLQSRADREGYVS